jgi:hypothetical protein
MNCEKCGSGDLRPIDVWSKQLWCVGCGHYNFDPSFENKVYFKEYFEANNKKSEIIEKKNKGLPYMISSRSLEDIEFDYDKAVIDGEFMEDYEED